MAQGIVLNSRHPAVENNTLVRIHLHSIINQSRHSSSAHHLTSSAVTLLAGWQ